MEARLLRDKANVALQRGRFEQAEVLLRQALTHAPRDAALWVKHADTLRKLHRLGDAGASYRMAATIFAQDGREGRAIAALKVALSLVPDHIDIIADLIRLEMHRTERAAQPASSLPAPVPDSAPLPETVAPQLALPAVASSPTDFALEVEVEVETVQARHEGVWPQVRRLNDREVAIKASASARWIVVTSSTPLDVRFERELSVDEVVPWLE